MTKEDTPTKKAEEVPDPPGAVSNQNNEEAEAPHGEHPEVGEKDVRPQKGKRGEK